MKKTWGMTRTKIIEFYVSNQKSIALTKRRFAMNSISYATSAIQQSIWATKNRRVVHQRQLQPLMSISVDGDAFEPNLSLISHIVRALLCQTPHPRCLRGGISNVSATTDAPNNQMAWLLGFKRITSCT